MDDGRTVRSCRFIHAHCMSNISKQLSCYCKDAENRVLTGRERRATWRRARRMRPLLARAGLERKTKRAYLDRAINGTMDEKDVRETGAGWMPWRWRPRKDAATRRNAQGRRWQPEILGDPNGATRWAHGPSPSFGWEGTAGSETSEYREEQRGFPE